MKSVIKYEKQTAESILRGESVSQVWVEFVASVVQASDLVREVAILLDRRRRLLHYFGAVLAHPEADVVFQVRHELRLLHILVLKEVGLLLEHSQNHRTRVRVRIHHANVVHLIGTLELWVLIHEHFVRMTGHLITVDSEGLVPRFTRWRSVKVLFGHY